MSHTFEQLMDLIDENLQEVNDNTPERIKRIEELLDFLNYNLRLTKLTDEEKEAFVQCMEGQILSDGMRATLDAQKTEKQRDYYITMWARANYFHQCAWMEYLHGQSTVIPHFSKK